MSKLPLEEALEIARQTRNKILEGDVNTTNILYGCFSVSKIMGDDINTKWIFSELTGYGTKDVVPGYRNFLDKLSGSFNVWHAVPKLEYALKNKEPLEVWITIGNNRFGKKFTLSPDWIQSILSAINTNCLIYLADKITELQYKGLIFSIVESSRKNIEQKLQKSNPDAFNELKSIYNILSTGSDTTDWAHVATSCRRVLKLTADIVFPPTTTLRKSSDGKEHKLKEDDYINRLCAFIEDKKGSKIAVSETEYLGAYLSNIVEQDSKGVHDTIGRDLAEQLAVHTFLILNEVLRWNTIKEG